MVQHFGYPITACGKDPDKDNLSTSEHWDKTTCEDCLKQKGVYKNPLDPSRPDMGLDSARIDPNPVSDIDGDDQGNPGDF